MIGRKSGLRSRSLSHERELLAEWRADFNQNRPRTSLKRAHAE